MIVTLNDTIYDVTIIESSSGPILTAVRYNNDKSSYYSIPISSIIEWMITELDNAGNN